MRGNKGNWKEGKNGKELQGPVRMELGLNGNVWIRKESRHR